MTRIKSAIVSCGAAALLLAAAGAGHATGIAARTTYLTFSGPVALPTGELNAGTYIFELADPLGAPSLVRVLSRDRRKIYLLAFTNAVQRPLNLRGGQMVSLGESRRGEAPPITAWYPVGDSVGREFIYDK